MGMFGNIDIAGASDIIGPPVNAYLMTITYAEVKATKNEENKFGLNLKFTISDGAYEGYDFPKWLGIPSEEIPTDEKERANWERNRTNLKRWLGNLGIPESRMNDVNAEDLLGIEVIGHTKLKRNQDDFSPTEVSWVELPSREGLSKMKSSSSGVSAKANPFD